MTKNGTPAGASVQQVMTDEQKQRAGRIAFQNTTIAQLAALTGHNAETCVDVLVDMIAVVIADSAQGSYPALVANLQEAARAMSERATDRHNIGVAALVEADRQ